MKCIVEGCDLPRHGNGLCHPHYRAEKAKTAPPCSVEGCGRGALAKGLCSTHYRRKERQSFLDPSKPQDWGPKSSHPLRDTWGWQRRAGLTPEWLDFWAFVRDVGDRPSPNHRLHRLRMNEPMGPGNFEWRDRLIFIASPHPSQTAEYRRLYAQARREKFPRDHRNYGFKNRYGIGYDEYQAMQRAQGGVCLICKKPETSLNQHTHEARLLSVDHCHDTGKIRGLLCKRCNTGIGAFEEDPELMKAAVRYIRRHKPK